MISQGAAKHSALFIFAAALVLAVAGCTGLPTAHTATPVAQQSDPPAASTAPVQTIDTIVVRPTGLDLTSKSVIVRSVSYTTAAAEFTAALTEAIGTSPVVKDIPSTDYRIPDMTRYDWAGLVVTDDHLKQGGPGPNPNGPATVSIRVTAPSVGTVAFTTEQGFKAGDTVSSVASTLGIDPSKTQYFAVPAETGAELGPSTVPGEKNAPAVMVGQASNDPTTVEIIAPYNFGDGHDI